MAEAAELNVEPEQFEYDGITRTYSVEPSGPGIYSILIDGRSYQATLLAPGTIQVNDQIFAVDLLRSPRASRPVQQPSRIAWRAKYSPRPCPEKSFVSW